MTRQLFTSGEEVTYTKLNNVSNQTVPQCTTAQRTGMTSVPEGMIVYDSDDRVYYWWDGSVWIMQGGRRIGCHYGSNSATYSSGSDHLITFDVQYDDDDGMLSGGTGDTFLAPAFAQGVYVCSLTVVSGNAFGFGGAGGIIKLDRSSGGEVWSQPVPSSYDGSTVYPSTTATVSTPMPFASGGLKCYLAHTCGADQTFSAYMHMYWICAL